MVTIDAQVHLNRDIGLEAGLFAMHALGIDAVVIDEFSGMDPNGELRLYRLLPNGIARAEYPLAREATRLFPGRFVYTAKIDPHDPELRDLIEEVERNPHQVCIRIVPASLARVEQVAAGEYRPLFRFAESLGVPVMLCMPRQLHLVEEIVKEFPDLPIVVDHVGILPLSATFAPGDAGTIDPGYWFAALDRFRDAANVSIKLCQAPLLSDLPFSFVDLVPHVRRLIDAFGERRIMWASDHTQTKHHHSWAEALLYLQAGGVLSDEERRWIFAETARTVLGIPTSETFGIYRKPRRGGGDAP